MHRVVLIGIIVIIMVSSVLGATVASLEEHPYWYVSRIGAFIIGVTIGLISMYQERITFIKYIKCIYAAIIGLALSLVALPVINSIESSLISNRSYGHIIGSAIIIAAVFLIFQALNKLKHLIG